MYQIKQESRSQREKEESGVIPVYACPRETQAHRKNAQSIGAIRVSHVVVVEV